jgi:hypothetical protein
MFVLEKPCSPFSPQKNSHGDDQTPVAYAPCRSVDKPLDPIFPFSPFEPFDPTRRPPMPKRPFEFSENLRKF